MFEGFVDERVDVGEVSLQVRYAGTGPAVLLVHGHPRTSSTWYAVAPALVERGFTVVCPDMRGYGRSGKAAVRADHSQQSKRAVAADLVELMRLLGRPRFSMAGHDRGCYVAMHAALNHPDAVERLAVLDGVPISDALRLCGATFAQRWYHWFFFAQPEKPERAINADPDKWYSADPLRMGAENYAEYRRAIHDPQTVLAMLEDYRAGLGVDRQDELDSRQRGALITCPTLHLWSSQDDLVDLYGDPLSIWATWCTDLRGGPVDSGHHMAEDNPLALTDALASFFAG
jgi:haloacetate dehalogenase